MPRRRKSQKLKKKPAKMQQTASSTSSPSSSSSDTGKKETPTCNAETWTTWTSKIKTYAYVLRKNYSAQPRVVFTGLTKNTKPAKVKLFVEGPFGTNPDGTPSYNTTTKRPLEIAPVPDHVPQWRITKDGNVEFHCAENCDCDDKKKVKITNCRHPPIFNLERNNTGVRVNICASGIPITLMIRSDIFEPEKDLP